MVEPNMLGVIRVLSHPTSRGSEGRDMLRLDRVEHVQRCATNPNYIHSSYCTDHEAVQTIFLENPSLSI